jgi:CHAD domain-containing protein
MRYAADSFERIYDAKSVARFLKHVSVLQDELGLLNDVATADRLLASLSRAPDDGCDLARGAALVQGWWGHVAAERTAKLDKKLGLLFKADPFWQRP